MLYHLAERGLRSCPLGCEAVHNAAATLTALRHLLRFAGRRGVQLLPLPSAYASQPWGLENGIRISAEGSSSLPQRVLSPSAIFEGERNEKGGNVAER